MTAHGGGRAARPIGMFDHIWQRRAYHEKLVQITRKASPQPAELAGAATCQRSGVCCWRRPCDLHPGADVPRLAAFLGLSPAELFRDYLVVDTGPDDGFRLSPRRADQDGGSFLSASETWSLSAPCVFLEPGGCRVHAAKPTGGAQWSCAMPKAEQQALANPAWARADLEALGWDGESEW